MSKIKEEDMLNILLITGTAILATAGICLCVVIAVATVRVLTKKKEGKE